MCETVEEGKYDVIWTVRKLGGKMDLREYREGEETDRLMWMWMWSERPFGRVDNDVT